MDDIVADISSDEFDTRLRDKLLACTPATLARWLLDYAYDEMVEEFNNDILSDIEAELPDEDGDE